MGTEWLATVVALTLTSPSAVGVTGFTPGAVAACTWNESNPIPPPARSKLIVWLFGDADEPVMATVPPDDVKLTIPKPLGTIGDSPSGTVKLSKGPEMPPESIIQ
jgi:hypothetical protein